MADRLDGEYGRPRRSRRRSRNQSRREVDDREDEREFDEREDEREDAGRDGRRYRRSSAHVRANVRSKSQPEPRSSGSRRTDRTNGSRPTERTTEHTAGSRPPSAYIRQDRDRRRRSESRGRDRWRDSYETNVDLDDSLMRDGRYRRGHRAMDSVGVTLGQAWEQSRDRKRQNGRVDRDVQHERRGGSVKEWKWRDESVDAVSLTVPSTRGKPSIWRFFRPTEKMSKNETGRGGRAVSGIILERGERDRPCPTIWTRIMSAGFGNKTMSTEEKRRRRKKTAIVLVIMALLIIIIAVPAATVKRKSSVGRAAAVITSSRSDSANTDALSTIDRASIPVSAQGTITDPFSWADTSDFNITYTAESVGGLPLIGLNSSWDDSVRANDKVPVLSKPFGYGTRPIRGINLGGWLVVEPFITPSLFDMFARSAGVVDEWTLTAALGTGKAKNVLEQHYSTFIRRNDFVRIRAAGFDHVRIPFGYWAVGTAADDPLVRGVSWRYLLRAIEWARQSGLRVKLDLHGAPGSQNGWNHSGRQSSSGPGWLDGSDQGQRNGNQTLEAHDAMSAFFAQDRYRNIVTLYGLVNEPKMTSLDPDVVLDWSRQAINRIRQNGYSGIIVLGDGFRGLDKWKGGITTPAFDPGSLLLDVHQYLIFNTDLLPLTHTRKLDFTCGNWHTEMTRSSDTSTGFGPTICGEWSQADTDCARYLNNVGVGSRWDGTLRSGASGEIELDPMCPIGKNPGSPDQRCNCELANADPSTYSDVYKRWLRSFAEAQMEAFELGWGWFYWTWKTESAPQWSYEWALREQMVPPVVWDRQYVCGQDDWDGLAENY